MTYNVFGGTLDRAQSINVEMTNGDMHKILVSVFSRALFFSRMPHYYVSSGR